MSPMSGFNYLDSMVLSGPIDHGLFSSFYRNGTHEALERLRQRWRLDSGLSSTTGIHSWDDQNVEWLRTNILMELEGTPGKRGLQRIHTPNVPTAYTWIFRDLVSPQSP